MTGANDYAVAGLVLLMWANGVMAGLLWGSMIERWWAQTRLGRWLHYATTGHERPRETSDE